MIFKFIFFLSFLFVFSCANFVNKIDDDLLTQKSIPYKKEVTSSTYCKEENSDLVMISENMKSQQIFKDYAQKFRLGFAEKIAVWTFVQMIERPDLSGPNAKMQILLNYGGKDSYYYFYSKSKEVASPLFYGLEYLLKKYKGTRTLLQLAKQFDNYYPNSFYVSEEFANFLNLNFSIISKDKNLNKFYSRADEPLRKGERITKQSLTPFVLRYLKNKKSSQYIASDYLFKYKRNNLITTSCNYDMSLYNSSIYLIQESMIKSNTYGLKDKRNRFLALTTQSISDFISLEKSGFFKTLKSSSVPVMCKFKSPLSNDKSIWLTSTDSRDPGQHLYHLIEYGLHSVNSVEEMDTMIRFSRHLFLKNPVRLILESERSSEGQLSELLKLNMPIYNSGKLGKIWAYYRNKDKENFIIDDRRSGAISCQKE